MTQELIAKLESASEGSRELDALIWCATCPGGATYDPAKKQVTYPDGAFAAFITFEPYTTSIDAALALAERVLPGFGFFLRKDKDGCNCGLVYPDAHFVTPGCGQSATPALALCIATLKASAAEGAGHE